jgi:hypothetical protein
MSFPKRKRKPSKEEGRDRKERKERKKKERDEFRALRSGEKRLEPCTNTTYSVISNAEIVNMPTKSAAYAIGHVTGIAVFVKSFAESPAVPVSIM